MPRVCSVLAVCTADLARVWHLFGCLLPHLRHILRLCVCHLPHHLSYNLTDGSEVLVGMDGSKMVLTQKAMRFFFSLAHSVAFV